MKQPGLKVTAVLICALSCVTAHAQGKQLLQAGNSLKTGCAVLKQKDLSVAIVKAARVAQRAAQNRSSSSGGGILARMDQMGEQGVHATQLFKSQVSARETRLKVQESPFSLKTQLRREMLQTITQSIVPTPVQELPALGHPFIGQEADFALKYQAAFKDFAAFRDEFSTHMYYAHSDVRMAPGLARLWLEKLAPVQSKLVQLATYVYPKDAPLAAALEYMDLAAGSIDPILKGLHLPLAERAVRVFNRDEFFLEEAAFENVLKNSGLEKAAAFPAHLKIAVINDDEEILSYFELWKQQGFLGKASLMRYTRPEAFLQDYFSGETYDLVISDFTVPGSNVPDSIRRFRAAGAKTPVILCSGYAKDNVLPLRLFKQGFDGFIAWPDIVAGDEVAFDATVLTRALERYFFYRDYYKW